MTITHLSRTYAPLVIIFMLFFTIPSSAGNQSSFQHDTAFEISENEDLALIFEQEHATIIAKVRQGDLPAEVGDKAEKLKIGFEKYLIETDAQLQILEIDVRHTSGEKQVAALNRMMELTAKRERTKIEYLTRLHALITNVDLDKDSSEPRKLSQKAKPSVKKKKEEDSSTKWRTETLDIEIEIAPEDISKGEHD